MICRPLCRSYIMYVLYILCTVHTLPKKCMGQGYTPSVFRKSAAARDCFSLRWWPPVRLHHLRQAVCYAPWEQVTMQAGGRGEAPNEHVRPVGRGEWARAVLSSGTGSSNGGAPAADGTTTPRVVSTRLTPLSALFPIPSSAGEGPRKRRDGGVRTQRRQVRAEAQRRPPQRGAGRGQRFSLLRRRLGRRLRVGAPRSPTTMGGGRSTHGVRGSGARYATGNSPVRSANNTPACGCGPAHCHRRGGRAGLDKRKPLAPCVRTHGRVA